MPFFGPIINKAKNILQADQLFDQTTAPEKTDLNASYTALKRDDGIIVAVNDEVFEQYRPDDIRVVHADEYENWYNQKIRDILDTFSDTCDYVVVNKTGKIISKAINIDTLSDNESLSESEKAALKL